MSRNSRVGRFLLLGALFGCRSFDPFENDVPKVVSVNGLPYVNFGPVAFPNQNAALDVIDRFIAVPGEDLQFEVIVDDPEGRDVRLWFPMAPPGWDFDPDAMTGTWHVPDPMPPLAEGVITAFVDDPLPRDPRQKEFVIPILFDPGADTGYEAP